MADSPPLLTLSQWRKAGRPHVPVLVKEYMPSQFPPAGAALVWLLNGTGRLRTEMRPLPEPYIARLFYQSALMLDDQDLIRYRCSECPTCPFLLEATGLSEVEVAAADAKINAWTLAELSSARPRRWIKDYLPLLSLCEPGFYWVIVKSHFPTDGNGRFFWSEIPPNCPQNLLSFYWGGEREDFAYLLPTQQTSAFNKTSFENAAQTNQTHPGVAFFLGGYGSALLDGHHRATAAAIAGRSFSCVTFIQCGFQHDRTFESPLSPPGILQPKRLRSPDLAHLRSSWPPPIEHQPGPVNQDSSSQSPVPVGQGAQDGVRGMPITVDWYYGVVLRQFFEGTLTDQQWKIMLRHKSVPSPKSRRRMRKISNDKGERTVHSIYELPLIGGLIGLRVLEDPTWQERWNDALTISVDKLTPNQIGLSDYSPPTPFAKQFITELFARNESTHPELVADLRNRFLS